jgi:predicted N-acyltransferase
VRGLAKVARAAGAESAHILFCRDDEAAFLADNGFIRRATHQFHFRNPGYDSFEAFLGALKSAARKQIRKERRHIEEQGLEIVMRRGHELSADDWQRCEALYLHTASRKWGRPYLHSRFFSLAPEFLGDTPLVFFAQREGEVVAMSLSFAEGRNLYGRYWGAFDAFDGLHFELCYYRLIEQAIVDRLLLVEAGAQGEHKLKRGFVPVVTHSVHRFENAALAEAVTRAVRHEERMLLAALPEMTRHAPFRDDTLPDFPALAGIDLALGKPLRGTQ